MANGDRVATHDDLVRHESEDFLAFPDIQGLGAGVQASPEIGKRLDQAQVPRLIGRRRGQRLQFRLDALLSFSELRDPAAQLRQRHQALLIRRHQALDGGGESHFVAVQRVFTMLEGICSLRRVASTIDFCLDHAGVLQQSQDLVPDDGIQMVLSNRPGVARRALQMPIAIRPEASVVIEPAAGRLCRGPIEGVATALADQHALQECGFDRASWRKPLVLLELFLGPSKCRVGDQCGHRNLNPVLARPFVVRAVASGNQTPLTKRPGDALPRSDFGFPEAGVATVRRIPQHPPHRRPFPTRRACPRRDLTLIEVARDRVDAQSLLNIGLTHQSDRLRLGVHDLVIRRGGVTLLDVPVPVGRAPEHTDRPVLRAVPLSPSRPLENLGALVFGDHALELHEQRILRRCAGRPVHEDESHAAAGQLLRDQDLVRILATQAIRRVNQHRLDVPLCRQIAHGLEAGTQQRGATVAVILKLPLRWDHVAMRLGVPDQRCHLAADRVLLFLAVRRHSRIERGGCAHSAPPSLARHEAPVAPASMGRARARRTPPPISPLTIDRIDTPRAPDATDRTNDQARPLPRFTIASTARLTISLSVSPLEAAYVRSRCTRVRESFTVKATLASVTATGAFNRRACRRYRYAWRGDRSQSCTIRSTASGRSSRRDSTWRAWLRRSAFSAAVARPMGHKYTTVSDRVQAPLPVPDDSLKLEVAFCVQAVTPAPCGVPSTVSDHTFPSSTPACSHPRMRPRILESATRCATIRSNHSWLTESKKRRMSASSTQFTYCVMSAVCSARNARCGLRRGRNPYEKPTKSTS